MAIDLRKEALLNEYKGNLFEFLVARAIAKVSNFEGQFLQGLTDNMFMVLSQQEEFLRNNFESLLNFLPLISEQTAVEILSYLKITTCNKVEVVGMITATMNSENTYQETDLVIHDGDNQHFISLKLSKRGSFTNTKSAGVKSVLGKYFQDFKVDLVQERFNEFYDLEFDAMAMEMYKELDIPYSKGFEGWENYQQTVLPGQLTPSLKKILYSFYEVINLRLGDEFQKLLVLDPQLFTKSINSLMGFSNTELVQVTAFHQNTSRGYTISEIRKHSIQELEQMEKIKTSIEVNKTNFEISSQFGKLQVRLKPMNKFTHRSYKINCSVKLN